MSTTVVRDLFHLIQHGIEAIRPARLVEAGLKLERSSQGQGAVLVVSNRLLFPSDQASKPDGQESRFVVNKNVYLVAFGKAALGKYQTIFLGSLKQVWSSMWSSRNERGCSKADRRGAFGQRDRHCPFQRCHQTRSFFSRRSCATGTAAAWSKRQDEVLFWRPKQPA